MRTSQKTPETVTTIEIDLVRTRSTWLGWTSGAPSFCKSVLAVVGVVTRSQPTMRLEVLFSGLAADAQSLRFDACVVWDGYTWVDACY